MCVFVCLRSWVAQLFSAFNTLLVGFVEDEEEKQNGSEREGIEHSIEKKE